MAAGLKILSQKKPQWLTVPNYDITHQKVEVENKSETPPEAHGIDNLGILSSRQVWSKGNSNFLYIWRYIGSAIWKNSLTLSSKVCQKLPFLVKQLGRILMYMNPNTYVQFRLMAGKKIKHI